MSFIFQVGDNHFSQKFIPPSYAQAKSIGRDRALWPTLRLLRITSMKHVFSQPLGSLTKSWGLEDWRWRILIIHVENWINSEDHIVWLTFLCGLHDFFGVGTKNIYKFTISKKIGFAIQKKLPKSPGTRSFSQHYGQVDHGHLAFASIGLASPSHLGEVEEGCWSWRMTPPTPHTIWVFP